MFSKEQVLDTANKLNIVFDKYSFNEFLDGMNIEAEHGRKNDFTNVTNDDPIVTAKIVLAHLNEYPNYYNSKYGLSKFEEFLKSKLNS